ncbi:broad substrate specificity ATP-binding cassette transporter ABCG2-like [Oscarella lobularis]|uniref:broad substrate specificity ATP-binding cassette transporter ABCG2-like n=1 Tax=Oscarella lobularis TaxID=121494 RepID=UPI0033136113
MASESHEEKSLLDSRSLSEYGSGADVKNGSTLSYQNIVYAVRVRKKGPCRPADEKVILHNVSGIMRRGMNAILGPTGSGKTTLLDILAGRKDPGGVKAGQVLLDGRPLPINFKCISGYVIQDDIIMGALSVRENLQFSAALRLPRTIGNKEKRARVDMVINELGLEDVAESKIGTELIRGISGGERKRTNIGMELITLPSVLFLDEPTTGLDAFTAASVMRLLHQLSRRGRTIVFSIHQPRYAIFKLFDDLTLLGNGRTIFHGSPERALKFFEENGYRCDDRENPADFFLDVIQKAMESVKNDEDQAVLALATKYMSSPICKDVLADIEARGKPVSPTDDMAFQRRQSAGYATSFPYQLFEVSKRTITNLFRNPVLSILQWVMSVVFGLIIGGIYFQVTDTDPTEGVQNRVGALFFLVLNMIFANMSAVQIFVRMRPIFKHESLSGYYRVSAYFFAEVLCDVLPLRIIPTIILGSISYWMIGLSPAADKFFFFLLDLNLTTLAACALAFLFSSLVSTEAVATLLLALVFTMSMLFGGLLVNLRSLPSALRWLNYLSIFRYSLEGLSINELKGMQFCLADERINGTCIGPGNSTGNDYLVSQGFTNDIWTTQIALGSFIVGILFLAYLRLVLMKKNR